MSLQKDKKKVDVIDEDFALDSPSGQTPALKSSEEPEIAPRLQKKGQSVAETAGAVSLSSSI